jgi:surface polysaccharide O-acyltransferase-like enzyme
MNHDYVASTYIFALGVTMIALSNSRFLRYPGAAKIGPLVVGIYTSHMIFVDLFKPADKQFGNNPVWSIAYVLTVFFLSFMFVKLLLRLGFTRRLVT